MLSAHPRFCWHGFVSTTKNIEVLSNAMFLGQTGTRTIFSIRLTQGQARDITRYSLLPAEDEVMVPPGCRFVVCAVLPLAGLACTYPRAKRVLNVRKNSLAEDLVHNGTADGMAAPASTRISARLRRAGNTFRT